MGMACGSAGQLLEGSEMVQMVALRGFHDAQIGSVSRGSQFTATEHTASVMERRGIASRAERYQPEDVDVGKSPAAGEDRLSFASPAARVSPPQIANPSDVGVKRKRGRPRKDASLSSTAATG